MTITGEVIAIIVGFITIAGVLTTWAVKSGRRAAKLEGAEDDVTEIKKQMARQKQECAEDLRAAEERANRRMDDYEERAQRDRDKLDEHISGSVEVHTMLAAITANMDSFNRRIDRFEDTIGKQIGTLFALLNGRGPTGPA